MACSHTAYMHIRTSNPFYKLKLYPFRSSPFFPATRTSTHLRLSVFGPQSLGEAPRGFSRSRCLDSRDHLLSSASPFYAITHILATEDAGGLSVTGYDLHLFSHGIQYSVFRERMKRGRSGDALRNSKKWPRT